MANTKYQIPNHKVAYLPVVTDLTFGLRFESPWKFRSEIRELFGNWKLRSPAPSLPAGKAGFALVRGETGNSRLEGEL